MAGQKHIVVVGAGIVGASIAWHLAEAGAAVTVVAGVAGGVATPSSFAWINASWGNPEPYFHLRQRSIREWTRLAVAVPGIQLNRTGGLCWDLPAAELDAFERLHSAWGYDVRRVDRAEVSHIEPNMLELPETALFLAEEGSVEPVVATLALLDGAERRGARILAGLPVGRLVRSGDRVTGVQAADDVIEADEIVVAAGVATSVLVATAGIELALDTPPGLIVHSRPHERLLNGVVLARGLHMRQTLGGRIIAGADFGGGDPGDDADGNARRLFSALKTMLRGGDGLELEFHTVGRRPTPGDGFPIVSRAEGVKGLYLAVTHSGVTLAPAVGLFAAEELLSGKRHALLAPYALSRFGPAEA